VCTGMFQSVCNVYECQGWTHSEWLPFKYNCVEKCCKFNQCNTVLTALLSQSVLLSQILGVVVVAVGVRGSGKWI